MTSDFEADWQVDLATHRVRHISGFSARVCEMPLTEAELRGLNADGLVAIGTVRADNGARWAVLATSEDITLVERWAERDSRGTGRNRALNTAARDAARVWLRAYLPPPTVDERTSLRPSSAALR
jgi:hypothetical protein